MKLVITTANPHHISDDVLTLLNSHRAKIIKFEAGGGQIYLETQELPKPTQGTMASQLMKITGVKWVNQVEELPEVETQNLVASLMQVMPNPVLGINTKGQIVFTNRHADAKFKPFTENQKMPKQMKHLFVSDGWQERINKAAGSKLPVSIQTIAGPLLLEVKSVKSKTQDTTKVVGAMLLFTEYNKIKTSNYLIKGEEIDGLNRLIFQSDSFKTIMQKVKTFAQIEAPLSLVGEIGTGKKLLAQACHSLSDRSHELFSLIDCKELKSDELEAQLFGTENRQGVLALNQSGSVYFSHIEYMTPFMQSKLLDHLKQSKNNLKIRTMVSSTLRLEQHQQNGKLNAELVGMLDVLRLNVTPLRERTADIEPLINHFLNQFNQQLNQSKTLSVEAIEKMNRYYWPGNVSQLRMSIFQAVMTTKSDTIQANNLNLAGAISLETDLAGLTLNEAVSEFEKHFLQHWYQKYPSTRKLARQLGVSHTTIAQKVNKYNLNQDQD